MQFEEACSTLERKRVLLQSKIPTNLEQNERVRRFNYIGILINRAAMDLSRLYNTLGVELDQDLQPTTQLEENSPEEQVYKSMERHVNRGKELIQN